jgi:Protein of unknown function (DUF1036)
MRVVTLVGLCLSLTLAMAKPGDAQLGDGGTFVLKVCNSYDKPIQLALVHRATPNDQRFVVKGWFGLEPGCAEADVPRGNFGTFAFAPGADGVEQVWAGDIPICVNLSSNFERIVTENYHCRKEMQEVVVPFQPWRVTDEPSLAIEFK